MLRCQIYHAFKSPFRIYPPPLSTLIFSPSPRQALSLLHSRQQLPEVQLVFLTRVGPCLRRGERPLSPAWIKAEDSVAAAPKQFIYLADWLDPVLRKADCLFEGKSKVLFCAAVDMPFPPHQCNVKVLCIQCLQTCLTNIDFDKVLAKTGASTGARVG